MVQSNIENISIVRACALVRGLNTATSPNTKSNPKTFINLLLFILFPQRYPFDRKFPHIPHRLRFVQRIIPCFLFIPKSILFSFDLFIFHANVKVNTLIL